METILGLLTLIAAVLFIVGLFSPDKSLFWLKANRTRLKSSLIYVGLFFAFGIIGSQLFPVDKSKEKGQEKIGEKQTKEFEEPQNENVSEWLSLKEKKKEKFIKKHIKGTWLQVLQLGLTKNNSETELIVNRNFKTEYKAKGDFVCYEEFIPSDGFFDFPHYVSKSQTDKGPNEYKTSWQVVKDEVVLATGTTDQTNEKVLYLSDNLCVRKLVEPLTGTEMIHYLAKVANGVVANYQPELSALILVEAKEAYERMQEGVSIINGPNNISGYQTIYDGYKKLGFVSKLDTSINLEADEVVKYISSGLKEKYPAFVINYSSTFTTQIEQLRKNEIDFVFFEKYSQKMDEMKSLIEIGKAFKQDNSTLKKEIALHEKDYKKLYNNYALYGDMSQTYLMEAAAKDFVEENAKDPSSIDVIDSKTGLIGKTSKGLAYQIVFRGKNSFGALVVNSQKLLLKWDVSNKIYYVAGVL
jgi:hypothetical protein